MKVLQGLQVGWRRRLPLILQTEAAECGIASLAMIASYLGHNTDLAGIRRSYGVSLKGATLNDLIRVAEQLQMVARPVRVSLDELSLLRTPCILHWDLNHFVVLKSVGRRGVVIHDPRVGARRMPLEEASRHFTGVALELTPTSEFNSTESPPSVKFSAILGHMVGINRTLMHLLFLALTIELFAITSPLFMQWVVDHALLTANYDLLLVLIFGFTLLLLIRTLLSVMRGWMLIGLEASLKVQARANLFSHLIDLPAAYFGTRHMGDVLSRFNSQDTILKSITTELLEALLDGLMVSLTLFIMFLYSPRLASLVLACVCLYGALRWLLYRPLRQASAEAIVWGARQKSHFLETLRGIQTIKLFNGQDNRRARWLNLLVETVNRRLITKKLRLLFRTVKQFLFGGLMILVVGLGAQDVIANSLSIGMLLAFIAYQDQFVRRATELINKFVDLQMLRLHAERLADIALTPPEVRTRRAIHPRERRAVGVEVKNLSFRYSPNDPLVLDGVEFRVEPGESVALSGSSGGGKTTLIKLLAGLLQPTEGEILVDGIPMDRIGIDAYRAMIGVVMQEDKLFAGSIQDNVSFFSDKPDIKCIEACTKVAAIHEDIKNMPMAYETLIGDMGTALSGGQKQRLLIARALYRQPNLLLLDEATSHLDLRREKWVSAAIKGISMTRIIAAHRPETLRSADRVIGLENGKILKDLHIVVDSKIPAPSPRDIWRR
jgi:ATP-binding cassette subfamily B protein RaxB